VHPRIIIPSLLLSLSHKEETNRTAMTKLLSLQICMESKFKSTWEIDDAVIITIMKVVL
jgi:hypothetical protein